MTYLAWIQLVAYVFFLLLLAKPLGSYMAQIYERKTPVLMGWLVPVERAIYRLCAIHPDSEMNWKQYGLAFLCLNAFGVVWVYALQRLQAYLPLNGLDFAAVNPWLAFNTAVSFVTNTDWQAYSGEQTMSHFTQMLGFTSQNFLSSASGMALLMAFTRGMMRQQGKGLGNFGVDVVRGILYILLPLSCILALFLVSQGVVQTLKPAVDIQLIAPIQTTPPNASGTLEQLHIPLGPVASQVAIKQLGSNGGGFFNANAAHPFENPTPLTNFIESLAMLLIPAAFCLTFGMMVQSQRQGWALLVAMLVLFVPSVIVTIVAEQHGNPVFQTLNLDSTKNMEGKETRFGIVGSALWSVAATAGSDGATNSMLDSYMPIGGLIPLWMMHLGEVVFGGVGTGLTGLLMLVIITVFIAGLMVGRTPEYLGKKIEPFEMKMASVAVLIMPLFVLVATAVSLLLPVGRQSLLNQGAHGLTEMLYAFTSMLNNNGSAFAGLNANTPYLNALGGCLMLIGRFWVAIPVLAIAGSLVEKKTIPKNSGTLLTYTPLFIMLLVGVILLLGALSFLPVLALGPIVEGLMYG